MTNENKHLKKGKYEQGLDRFFFFFMGRKVLCIDFALKWA